MDPVLRRQYMAQSYYDFSLPWNFGFNYAVNYSISYTNNGTTGYRKNVTQTIGFNGSLNVTPKTGITFQGGYDIKANKLTTSSVSISRDLHCWQMSFSWIPFGFHRQLEFQHRRKGGIAFRPQIRQEPVDVRQYVLNPDPRLIHPPFHPRQSGYRLRQCGTVVVSRRRHRQQYAKQTKPGRKTDVCVYILTGNRNFTIF